MLQPEKDGQLSLSTVVACRTQRVNKHFIEKGIITVQDIFNGQGNLLSWVDVQLKYSLNKSYLINWLGLINCIPKLWKDKLINNAAINVNDENILNKQLACITSRIAYQKLIQPLANFPKSSRKIFRTS